MVGGADGADEARRRAHAIAARHGRRQVARDNRGDARRQHDAVDGALRQRVRGDEGVAQPVERETSQEAAGQRIAARQHVARGVEHAGREQRDAADLARVDLGDVEQPRRAVVDEAQRGGVGEAHRAAHPINRGAARLAARQRADDAVHQVDQAQQAGCGRVGGEVEQLVGRVQREAARRLHRRRRHAEAVDVERVAVTRDRRHAAVAQVHTPQPRAQVGADVQQVARRVEREGVGVGEAGIPTHTIDFALDV